MDSFFEELNKDGALNGLEIYREKWLDALGMYNLEKGKLSFLDLNETPAHELYDLMMQSLSYIEHVNRTLGSCDKRKRDAEVAMERELSKQIAKSSMKLNEAKAVAKVSDNYIKANYDYNSLSAYHDYLKRYMETLEKYHYAVKNRLQSLQSIQEKYGQKGH